LRGILAKRAKVKNSIFPDMVRGNINPPTAVIEKRESNNSCPTQLFAVFVVKA
jgi:hypothetical protein